MKKVVWNKKAKEFVKNLPSSLKKEFGSLLLLLQRGNILSPPASKIIRAIHQNAFELRVKDQSGTYRVIYILAVKNKILIPHGFKKKTQKTPDKEISIAKKRLKELLSENK